MRHARTLGAPAGPMHVQHTDPWQACPRGECSPCVRRRSPCCPQTNTSALRSPTAPPKFIHGQPVTWQSAVLAGAVGAGLLGYYNYKKDELQTQVTAQEVKTVGKPALGGPFTLVNMATGQTMSDTDLKGKFALLYFGFTFCPDICPNELVKMGSVIDGVAAAGYEVQPVFISIDPRRDSVTQMKAFLADFHPNFIGLTGTRDQIGVASKAFRVYFSKVDEVEDDEDDYLVDHSIVMYLLDQDGEFQDFFTQSASLEEVVRRTTARCKEAEEAKKAAAAAAAEAHEKE